MRTKDECVAKFGEVREYEHPSGEVVLFRKIDREVWQEHKAALTMFDAKDAYPMEKHAELMALQFKGMQSLASSVIVSHNASELDALAKTDWDLFENVALKALLWKREGDDAAKKKRTP